MRLKKLIVATAISDARTRAEPAMNRAPAVTDPGPSSVGGWADRIRLFPPGPAAGLLDQPILGQLPQME